MNQGVSIYLSAEPLSENGDCEQICDESEIQILLPGGLTNGGFDERLDRPVGPEHSGYDDRNEL